MEKAGVRQPENEWMRENWIKLITLRRQKHYFLVFGGEKERETKKY